MEHLKKILLAILTLITFSCNDDFNHPIEDIQLTNGEANFSKYIALGNSLTSGYRDNALYQSGQENSYPNILANLMKVVGGKEFKTPYMPNNIGGFANLPGFSGKLELKIANGVLNPVPTEAIATLDNISSQGPYQNMGVPGAKSYHLIAPNYGDQAGLLTSPATANPYFVRFASNATTSIIEDAITQKPTFFSLWIGNNDVLGYATSGGVGVDHNETNNLIPNTYGSSDISNVNVVKASINAVLKALTAVGAKGVIANIPSVSSVPYFTTVPYAPLSPTNPSFASLIDELNSTYEGLNKIFDVLGASDRKIYFSKTAANAVVIKDKDLTDLSAQITAALAPQLGLATATLYGMTYGQVRQATKKDLLLLPSSSVIGKVDETRLRNLIAIGLSKEQATKLSVVGVSYPMVDKYVLTEKETARVEAAILKYNSVIVELATAYNIALVDTYSEMQKLSSFTGIKYYGQTYTTKYISGGAFSLDGIHLTGNGYAIVANMFVDAINEKYKSTLRKVYPANYPGITIPK